MVLFTFTLEGLRRNVERYFCTEVTVLDCHLKLEKKYDSFHLENAFPVGEHFRVWFVFSSYCKTIQKIIPVNNDSKDHLAIPPAIKMKHDRRI